MKRLLTSILVALVSGALVGILTAWAWDYFALLRSPGIALIVKCSLTSATGYLSVYLYEKYYYS